MSMVTLYHLSPSRYRTSIQREGIRRMSMMAGRLVTHAFACWPRNGDAVRIAELHDTGSSYIDVWKMTVEREDIDYYIYREQLVYSDVPGDKIELVRSGKLER